MNLNPTIEAFEKAKSQMLSTTVAIHEEILFGAYLTANSKKIQRALDDVAQGNEELVRPAFIGEFSERLPPLKCSNNWTLHDKNKAKKNAAQLLLNIYLDNGMFNIRREGKSQMKADGRRVVIPHTYIVLGGEKQKRSKLIGLHSEPGVVNQKYIGSMKLNSSAKNLLKRMSSIPFKLSDIATEELIRKGYSLSKSFNYKEDSALKRMNKVDRYEDNIRTIMGLKDEEFYLSMKYDSRYREYYEFQLEGMRPQGKLWETLLVDRSAAKLINESGAAHIKHIIYVLRHGRATLDTARFNFKTSDYEWAKEQDPMDLEYDGGDSLNEFGERLLLNKLARALEMYWANVPCPYVFGKDLTNSGLIMAGVSFRSQQMVVAGNLTFNNGRVVDSHTVFGDAYGLDLQRSEVKKIHTALLHGSTNKTIANMLEVDEAVVVEGNLKAYGACVENISEIAHFGTLLVDNYRSKLEWRTPDGWLAFHEAKLEHVPFEMYSACARSKKGYTKDTVVGSCPITFDADGQVSYGAGYGSGTHSKHGVEVRLRGLYANITHSLDAYVLRQVSENLLDSDEAFLVKHDDYMVHPNDFDAVENSSKRALTTLSKADYYTEALIDIASKCDVDYIPELTIGDWDCELSDSCNFLMP